MAVDCIPYLAEVCRENFNANNLFSHLILVLATNELERYSTLFVCLIYLGVKCT